MPGARAKWLSMMLSAGLSLLPMGLRGCDCQGTVWFSDTMPEAGALPSAVQPLKRWELRARTVRVDTQLLLAASGESVKIGCQVPVEFFDGERRTAESLTVEDGPRDSRIVRGRFRHEPGSELTVVIVGDALSGTMQVGGKRYVIQPVEGALHRLVEVDPRAYPED